MPLPVLTSSAAFLVNRAIKPDQVFKGCTVDNHTIKLNEFDHTDRVTIAAHLSYRLQNRVKPDHRQYAQLLASHAPSVGNVALVCNVERHTVSADYKRSGDDSNGDNLVLIVRNGVQCTIMYCRTNQLNVTHLRVNTIIKVDEDDRQA